MRIPANILITEWKLLVISLCTAFLLAYTLPIPFTQGYNDLISGAISWNDNNKINDYIRIAGFFVLFIGIIFLLTWLRQRLITEHGNTVLFNTYTHVSIIAISPLLFYFVDSWNTSDQLNPLWFYLSLLLLFFVHLPIFKSLTTGKKLRRDEYINLSSLTASIALFAYFSSIGFSLLNHEITSNQTDIYSNPYYLTAIVIALSSIWLFTKEHKDTIKYLASLTLLAQAGIPFLYISLLPAHIEGIDESVLSVKRTDNLLLSIYVLISITLLHIIYRYISMIRCSTTGKSYYVISSLAIASVFVFIKTPLIGIPEISPDDYHFGEIYLPWVQWQQFDLASYAGYDPARGINQTIDGFIGAFLFDGSAAAISVSSIFRGVVLLIILSYIATRATNLLSIVYILLLIPFPTHLVVELCILVLILLDKRLLKNANAWFFAYLLSSLLLVLYRPQVGPAYTVGMGFIGYYLIRKELYSFGFNRLLMTILAVAVFMFLINTQIPLFSMMTGVSRYILHHAEVNTTAHSLPWQLLSARSQPLSIHASRAFIPLAIIILTFLLIVEWRRNNRRTVILYSYGSMTIILVFLMPYIFGRIGAGIERGPIFATYISAIFIPYISLNYNYRKNAYIYITTTILITGALYHYNDISRMAFLSKSGPNILTVQPDRFITGTQTKIPLYGSGHADTSHFSDIEKLRGIMDVLLDKNETFLDLTNRNALYFFLERKVPMESAAIYNIPSTGQQLRNLAKLDIGSIPVALLGDYKLLFNGGTASLRTPLIYRFLLQSYRPIIIERRFVLLLSRDKYQNLAQDQQRPTAWTSPVMQFNLTMNSDGSLALVAEAQPANESEIDILTKQLHNQNLGKLPVAWGRNIDTLVSRDRIKPIHGFSAQILPAKSPVEVFINLPVTRRLATGDSVIRADLLDITIDCTGPMDTATIHLQWRSSFKSWKRHDSYTLNISAGDNRLLIPMDSSPGWLLSDHIDALRVYTSGTDSCQSLSVKKISGHKRTAVSRIPRP